MINRLMFLLSALMVSSCASITALPLEPDGKVAAGQAEGVRYYLPRPYLLITELPVAPGGGGDAATSAPAKTTPNTPSAPAAASKDSSKDQGSSQPQGAAASAPSSNTSFAAGMISYSVKLIYLPDYSRPMALQVKAGIFGTANFAPTLQDGWMLSALSASVDSGTAGVLTALAGFKPSGSASTSGGGGGGKGGGSAAAAQLRPSDDDPLVPQSVNPKNDPLEKYSSAKLLEYGQAVGAGLSAPPLSSDLQKMSPQQLGVFMQGMTLGLTSQIRANSQRSPQGITWGENVLPPGLYSFEMPSEPAGVSKVGEVLRLRPVAYFCSDGVHAPENKCVHP